jgi:hypothetical protein
MLKDYIPKTDLGLQEWANSLSQKLSLAPTSFGITAAMATSLAAKVALFDSAVTAAQDPETRGVRTVFLKDEARDALISETRVVVRQVQGTATVTNDQRQALGIPVRDNQPTPRHAPALGPGITVREVRGRNIKIVLQDLERPNKKAKPPTAAGAALFVYTGTTPPEPGAPGWVFQGQATRRIVDIVLPFNATPETVWISGVWYTERGEFSPASSAVSLNLAAAEPSAMAMKIAA